MTGLLSHAVVLVVVLPLICAPLVAILRHENLSWTVTLVCSWCAFGLSLSALGHVMTDGPIVYELGGWPPPWGIAYYVDAFNGLVMVLVSGMGAICSIYARQSVGHEIEPHNRTLFYTMFLLLISGLNGIAATGDAFNAFVFLEISSLSTYTLVALGYGYRQDRRALMASYHYLIMGTVGATFYLIGVGLLYQMTGTLNISDLADRIQGVQQTTPVLAAFGFITAGLFIKVALFPLHQWLPNSYAYAPSVVTALLAATATKVSLYLLIRILLVLFGADFSFQVMPLETVIGGLAVAGMMIGSLIACFQTDLKRLFAYSSVAQVGYMVLGLSFVSVTGLTASIVHITNHAVIKGGLFLALGIVFYRLSRIDLAALCGLGKRMPWTAFALTLGGLSLIGVPLTAGFVSKWILVQAALEKGWWPVTVAILLSSLLAVIYVWRMVEVFYFRPVAQDIEDKKTAIPLDMVAPMWLMIALCVGAGIYTDWTVGVARIAAQSLMRVGY